MSDQPPDEPAGEDPPNPETILDHDTLCLFLEQAAIAGCKALPWGSNYTYALAFEAGANHQVLAIYKPLRGEVPLWDFPDGTLYRRERAAYLASRRIGWEFIPPTVIRDGPYGIGSVQLYIEPDPRASFERFRAEHEPTLQKIAVFDCLANNADRKAGHFLLGRHDGQLWGIDHGLTFNAAPKLRTVIWEYCNEPIPPGLVEDLRILREDPARLKLFFDELAPLLLSEELEALRHRLERLVELSRFPSPNSRRSYPWPFF